MGRRLKFALLVIVSQLLLIALAIAWVIHMVLIAVNGSVYFIEKNPMILWGEIAAVAFIALFATAVCAIQIYRLGERRGADERRRANERREGSAISEYAGTINEAKDKNSPFELGQRELKDKVHTTSLVRKT
jgi:hypothetical protein